MNLLALDTSTDRASVALAFNKQIISKEEKDIRQHAQCLLPMVEALLSSSGVGLKQLDGIVFGRGPGSFTGLRIGCSVAKSLAYALDLPLYPVSTLQAIAYGVNSPHVLAVLDARMNELYWAEFSPQGDFKEQVCAAEKIVVQTREPLLLAGVGFEAYLERIAPIVREQIVKTQVVYPEARTMLEIVLAGKVNAVSAAEALPLYIRDDVTQK